jgi:hypothetical protein
LRKANSTTALWNSRASMIDWSARPLGTRSLSAAAAWCATTLTAVRHPSTGSAPPACPVSRGRAVFAPSPGQSDESSGWYLTYVYDPVRDGSDLVIIDASDFEDEPVARVRLPRRVPHGFHGNWLPD